MRSKKMFAAVLALGLLAGACGNDDDTTAGPAGEGDQAAAARFCETAAALDDAGGEVFSNVDFNDDAAVGEALATFMAEHEAELDELVATAPAEIEDDVAEFVEANKEAGRQKSFEPIEDAAEAEEAIESWEDENCPEQEPEAQAFGGAQLTDEQRAAATTLDVTMVDYAYEGVPGELAAGPVVITATNGGDEEHEIVLVKVAEGFTVDELFQWALENPDEEPGPEQGLERFEGGAFAPPGLGVEQSFDLAPGTYAYACFIETEDGTPHAELGMRGSLSVA